MNEVANPENKMFTANGFEVLDGIGNAVAEIVYDSINKIFAVYDDIDRPEGLGITEESAIEDWMSLCGAMSTLKQPNPNQKSLF